ncbi:NAD(P)-dependent oxidoreductase [Streptomyces xinghaiensis]|uniref:NAD(P)-dependent oxidoreductase n=4 Tax=Streptomyces TaxID=1883 RepID=A0A3R7EID8_9ACTN|nr:MULTISPECIES: NAD(P)-dependent oxidoreductase [Streptomyces]AAD12165.1 4-ketoreductase [Streptomyces fradiae]AAD41816.1 hypothetical NDP-hexose 4-ketoreductase TylD [Streptomyces fradiae]KNE79462.1 epimerase [Streptomyces fradiae]OFA40110.1 epimerase [Streptomyces fradiae]PQM19485.1 NAD(P)-dependent oxidoreductase [Streptomyces xinghaiensis]
MRAAGDWAGRTVVVTGALGFIGSHYAERLAALGARVVGLHRSARPAAGAEPAAPAAGRSCLVRADLCDEAATRRAFQEWAPGADVVIHCAGLDGNAQYKRDHSASVLDANVRGTAHVLNTARDTGAGAVVLLSSTEVYCAPRDSPAREDEEIRRYVPHAGNGYVLSKIFCEIMAELHGAEFGSRIFRVRPGNVYGPRDGNGGTRTRVIPSMVARAAAGETIEIWGDGRQTRSFIHVEDLVNATLRMVEADKYPVMNIGSPEEVSILDLARTVVSAVGGKGGIRTYPDKPSGPPAQRLDLSRMRDVTGCEPRPLRVGIEQTIRWYRGHHRPSRAPHS